MLREVRSSAGVDSPTTVAGKEKEAYYSLNYDYVNARLLLSTSVVFISIILLI
jgi:hypothetical protein